MIINSYWLSGSANSGGTGVPADTEKTAVQLTSPIEPGANSGDVYHNWKTNDGISAAPTNFRESKPPLAIL